MLSPQQLFSVQRNTQHLDGQKKKLTFNMEKQHTGAGGNDQVNGIFFSFRKKAFFTPSCLSGLGPTLHSQAITHHYFFTLVQPGLMLYTCWVDLQSSSLEDFLSNLTLCFSCQWVSCVSHHISASALSKICLETFRLNYILVIFDYVSGR